VAQAPIFDLQSHSEHSDGALAPAQVVELAAAAGVELLALTDHDTVDGVGEALQAGRRVGIRVVPAVELSAVDGAQEDLHVLGYGVDHEDPTLRELLRDYREDRQRRIDAMTTRLVELGFELDRDELERRRREGQPVGRPHLAHALMGHPANHARLRAEGTDAVSELFARYLVPGAAAYVPRQRPSVYEAIEAIHAAGGQAVWAHPFWDIPEAEVVLAMIGRFSDADLDGVEAFYPTHSAEQVESLCDACDQAGLLTTGSSDFHGPRHATFSRFRDFELYGHAPRLGPIAI